MAISPNAKFQDVRLDMIEVDEVRARLLNPARVMRLADNIEDVGLLTPITVRPSKDREGYLLVCGEHRLAACRELGWKTIPAFVRELTDEQARQIGVQENLMREDLTVLDRALHLATEKAIYEARNPVAKHGGDHKSDQVVNLVHLISRRFTLEMAEALGCGEKAISRAIQIANGITPELHEEITGTPLADNQAQLLKLVDLPPEDRAPIVRTVKERAIYKVEKARQLLAGVEEQAPPPLEEAWQRKMTALWAGGKKGWTSPRPRGSAHPRACPRRMPRRDRHGSPYRPARIRLAAYPAVDHRPADHAAWDPCPAPRIRL